MKTRFRYFYLIFFLVVFKNIFGINSYLLFNNKEFNKTRANICLEISKDPVKVFSFDDNFQLGKLNYYSKNYKRADKYFNSALKLAGDRTYRANVYYWLGRNSLSNHDSEKAVQYFNYAFKENKNIEPEFLIFYGVAMYLIGRFDDALNLFLNFESQSNNSHKSAELPLFTGAAALGKGDYELAEKYLKQIIKQDSFRFFPLPDYLLGLNYYLTDETENSLEHLTKVKMSSERELQQRASLISGTIYFNEKDLARAINEFEAIINDTMDTIDEWKAQAYLRSGISHYKLKKTKTALLRFDSLKQKYPNSSLNELGLFYTARINQQNGKWKKAKTEYKQLIATYPQSQLSEKSMYNLGRILYQEQNYLEAIPILEDFVKNYNKSEFRKDAIFMLVICHEKIENDEKVKLYGEKYLKEFPYPPEKYDVHYILGEVGYKKKDYLYARRHFNNVVGGKRYAYALKRLGDIYYDLDSLPQAVQYYNQAENNCTDSLIDDIRWHRENTYLKQGIYNTRLDMFMNYLEKYPESRKAVMIQYEIGEYYLEKGNYYQAIAELDKVKEYGLFSDYTGQAEMRKAYAYKILGETSLAIGSYLTVINDFKNVPFYREAIKSVAHLYFAVQNYDSAVYFYNMLISDYPNSTDAESAMLQLVEINTILNKLTDVIKLSEQFIIRYPRSTNLNKVYLYLADSYKETGKYDQAEKTLKESISKIGKFGDAYFKLGEINLIQNKLVNSKNDFLEGYNLYTKENKKDLAALSLFEAGKCAINLKQYEQAKELLNQCIQKTEDERLRIRCEEQLKQIP